ncbi:MAG: polyphosphate kinase 2 family protein [Gammaproteobacteria bacterium]|nr:polyphosphate kinase 2 family protein [Gammaproteobacteria bacterium]
MELSYKQVIKACRVPAGRRVRLKDYDPGWTSAIEGKNGDAILVKERAEALLEVNRRELAKAQELLWASDSRAVLLVFQALDAAGKDGVIKHVMSGVNPQGCQVFAFKTPSDEELDHHFMWRYSSRVPERGRIGIFNRSYYEEVLVVRVHPEFLERQRLPPGKRDKSFWKARYDDINAFEKHLVTNGTVVLKFLLNVSKKEQKRRFLERLENPDKNWKFSSADIAERAHWDEYQEAFSDMLSATSTEWAPWHVVPADHKFMTRAIVSTIVATSIRELGLEHPEPDEAQKAVIAAARRKLLAER